VVDGFKNLKEKRIPYDKLTLIIRQWDRLGTSLYLGWGGTETSSGLNSAQRGPWRSKLNHSLTTLTDVTASFLIATTLKGLETIDIKLLGGITRGRIEAKLLCAFFRRFFLSSDLAQLDLGGSEVKIALGMAMRTGTSVLTIRSYELFYKEKYFVGILFRYDAFLPFC